MNKNFLKVIAVAAMVAPMGAAYGATDSTTFTVDATVVASCDVTATALNFGNIDPLVNATTNTDITTTIGVTCSNGTAYNVGLGAGTATAATVTTRKMTGGTNLLNYSLFRDSARSLNWGSTVATDTLADTGTGAAKTHTVYGRIPSGQETAALGAYADTITVTVTY